MKKAENKLNPSNDYVQNLIFNSLNFLEEEGKIKIDTIFKHGISGGIFIRVNGFIKPSNYKNYFINLKNSVMMELKEYLNLLPISVSKERLEIFKIVLNKIKAKTIIREDHIDNEGNIITINKFMKVDDKLGYFKDYQNQIEYIQIWTDIYYEVYNEIESMLNEIKARERSILSQTINENNNSYEWKNLARDGCKITKLFNELKRKRFIDKESNINNFKAIFNKFAKGQINWTGNGALSELLYLFYILWGEKDPMIKYVIKPNQPFKNLKHCFVCNRVKINESSIKTIYTKINNSEYPTYPARANELDRIIESL